MDRNERIFQRIVCWQLASMDNFTLVCVARYSSRFLAFTTVLKTAGHRSEKPQSTRRKPEVCSITTSIRPSARLALFCKSGNTSKTIGDKNIFDLIRLRIYGTAPSLKFSIYRTPTTTTINEPSYQLNALGKCSTTGGLFVQACRSFSIMHKITSES